MREKCKRCPSLIPASRMTKHLELKHDVQEGKDNVITGTVNDEQIVTSDSEEQLNDGGKIVISDNEEQSDNEEKVIISDTEEPMDEFREEGNSVLKQDGRVSESEDSMVVDDIKKDTGDIEDDDDDTIIPMGLSKRKRYILDDDDEEDEILKRNKDDSFEIEKETSEEQKSENDGSCKHCTTKLPKADLREHMQKEHPWLDDELDKKEISEQSSKPDSKDGGACTYCSSKVSKADLKEHMQKEHPWLDDESDDSLTNDGLELDDLDYDDVEVDYDEEGDDFFEEDDSLNDTIPADSLDTEDCDFCEETIERANMNDHLLKIHDINMTEDASSSATPDNTDMSLSPCPVCGTPIATAILSIHLAYYHAEIAPELIEKPKEEPKVEVEQVPELGDQCEMCDEKLPANKMSAHLLEVHDIKVIDGGADQSFEAESSSTATGDTEDPFDIPDFLREKPKPPKFKCHHCQKKFSTREKVDTHVEKKHQRRCQVCVTYKLVQENRYIGIMKQLTKTAKGLRDDKLIPNDSNSASQEDRIYNYEDFYPEEDYEECEECEDDFYWKDKEHECELTMNNVRILSGEKFNCGDPYDDLIEDKEEEFDYISDRLGRSFVDRASKEVSNAYVGEIVDDLVSTALGCRPKSWFRLPPPVNPYIRLRQLREDQNLRMKCQILAYRFLKRKETIPDVLQKAVFYENFRDSPMDELRRLNAVFHKEYKEEWETLDKERYEKKKEEKRKLQEDTLREMNTIKLYDYSKYFIPTIRPPKKPRKMQPKKEAKTPLLDSMMSNSMDNSGFKLPTGTALQMNDRNYLNKLKQQQDKTVKRLQQMQQGNVTNSKQYQDTMRELEVEKRRLKSLDQAPSSRNSFRQNTVKKELAPVKLEPLAPIYPYRPNPVKQEPGIRQSHPLGSMPGISIKKIEPKQPPKPEPKKESPALQRLQSLGLSISVGQNGQSRPLEPVKSSRPLEPVKSSRPLEPLKPKVEPVLNRSYPGATAQKPTSVLNTSVLETYRQMAGIKKEPVEPEKPAKPQSLWNASAKGRDLQPPTRDQLSNARDNPSRSLLNPTREPVRNQLQQKMEPEKPPSLLTNYQSQNRQTSTPLPSLENKQLSDRKPPSLSRQSSAPSFNRPTSVPPSFSHQPSYMSPSLNRQTPLPPSVSRQQPSFNRQSPQSVAPYDRQPLNSTSMNRPSMTQLNRLSSQNREQFDSARESYKKPDHREQFESARDNFKKPDHREQFESARDSFKKPDPRPYNIPRQNPFPESNKNPFPPQNRPQPSRPAPKAEYTDSQKLQLKSQILAYRMVSRKEMLPQIVKLAASNTNLKGMSIPKTEMRSLSNYFRQEYSAIAIA